MRIHSSSGALLVLLLQIFATPVESWLSSPRCFQFSSYRRTSNSNRHSPQQLNFPGPRSILLKLTDNNINEEETIDNFLDEEEETIESNKEESLKSMDVESLADNNIYEGEIIESINFEPSKSMDVESKDEEEMMESNEEESSKSIEVESLSTSQVIELIELSFFQACYGLAEGNIHPLRLFVVAVTTAAISKKYPVSALIKEVDDLPPSTKSLDAQERNLRSTWIQAIYLMTRHVLSNKQDFDYSKNNKIDGIDEEVSKTYGPVLIDLVALLKANLGLNIDNFVESRKDILLPPTNNNNVLVLEDGPEDDYSLRWAVVTQTIKVLFTTVDILFEEKEDSQEVEKEPPSKKKKKKTSSGKGFGEKEPPVSSKKKKKKTDSGKGFG